MTKLIKSFVRNESGATAIEYGLIAAVIGLGILTGAGALKNSVNNKFSSVGASFSGITANSN